MKEFIISTTKDEKLGKYVVGPTASPGDELVINNLHWRILDKNEEAATILVELKDKKRGVHGSVLA